MAERSYPSPKVRGSDRECETMSAQERPRGATPCPRSGPRPGGATPRPRSGEAEERSNPTSKERWLRGRRRAERSYSTFKVRRSGREEIPLVQGKEQRLCFAGAAVKRYPTPKVRETQVRRCCKRASEGRHTETMITKLANLITGPQPGLTQ